MASRGYSRVLGAMGLFGALSAGTLALLSPQQAQACGCTSPAPPPPDGDAGYVVSQTGEDIIFVVDEDQEQVAAHILIRYDGEPEEFGWLLPAPNVIDVELSEQTLFSLVSAQYQERISWTLDSAHCPQPRFNCDYHDPCPSPDTGLTSASGGDDGWDGDGGGATAGDGDGDGGDPGGVEVQLEKQIGDYEIVVFTADNAMAAVEWLTTNGYVVNETTTPYMQPYLDAGMAFVAAKLIPTADVSSIRPLKLTYGGLEPMIPLELTAVGADPLMPVRTHIFADTWHRPQDQTLVQLDGSAIGEGLDGDFETENNYSASLSRAVMNADWNAFVLEAFDVPPDEWGNDDPCCTGEWGDGDGDSGGSDQCGWADDGVCSCPQAEWEAADCPDIDWAAVQPHLETLSAKARVSRLVTRLSPNHMQWDPVFIPDPSAQFTPPEHTWTDYERNCVAGVSPNDQPEWNNTIERAALCSANMCGPGSCASSLDYEAGCVCDEGFSARAYVDLDGATKVTCLPNQGDVDLTFGIVAPEQCPQIDCGTGTCLERGGFPTCECPAGDVAVVGQDGRATCVPLATSYETPGGTNYTQPFQEMGFCAWPTPSCGDEGWLVSLNPSVTGVICEPASEPSPEDFEPTAPPVCADTSSTTVGASASGDADAGGSSASCACQTEERGSTGLAWSGLGLAGLAWIRRRHRRQSAARNR